MNSPHQHDIVIAGGGMAGASLAVGLAGAGFDVAIIEAVDRSADRQPSYDDRTLVVNRASLNILAHLGILDDALPRRPIRHIDVTRAHGFGHVRLDAAEHGLDHFGAVVVARELGNRLLTCLEKDEGITEYCPERLETFQVDEDPEADRVYIRLASGTQIETRLLVAADGTGSAVRQAAGIASTLHDYHQSAMIFNVMAEPASSDTAHERFTPEGPLAFLPQPEGRFGVVWIDSTDRIEEAMAFGDGELLARLTQRAGSGFRNFSQPGKRARYPLRLLRTPVPIGKRVVCIGNAANTVHPVSAQGFNLGLRDVAGLIEVLGEAHDPGAPVWMARYVQARKADQADTVRYTDTLARAFTNPSLPFRIGTGLGLAAHALLPGLKRRLVTSAMGFREPVSKLAREV
ncbi:MAG: FAD-dependent monooxygenase [Wenzhouxiangellaceae bacterium]|jgi:2-octaprenyl-6-methoxyphenol hydroxylase|nr:FAD-dependent monooxygenase [Wenzhouxiangellaceae bacterium]MBS3747385.1 FAD-dependent monooxygenase [Wenzhouxiangellaceae bacterium]MBS3823878.1 FAD-dependent monooxygenase [Wenzhouxiangellaceae bacterium]